MDESVDETGLNFEVPMEEEEPSLLDDAVDEPMRDVGVLRYVCKTKLNLVLWSVIGIDKMWQDDNI